MTFIAFVALWLACGIPAALWFRFFSHRHGIAFLERLVAIKEREDDTDPITLQHLKEVILARQDNTFGLDALWFIPLGPIALVRAILQYVSCHFIPIDVIVLISDEDDVPPDEDL